jgi:hypothetical protein
MKKLAIITVIAVGCLLTSQVYATTTFQVFSADLQDANGTLMPVSGLAMLVVDTAADGFGGPSPTAFVSGDDVILGAWNLSSSGTPGMLTEITAPVVYSGGISAGDPLRLFWFPTLTISSLTPGYGTQYGSYTDAVGIDGSAAWVMPSDTGAQIDLYFLTQSQSGSNPDTAGRASNVTPVPEPTTYVLVGFGLLGAWLMRRRSR